MDKYKMKMWFIEKGQLLFLNESTPGTLGGSEIQVDAKGVNDGAEHLGWCLSFLMSSCPELEKLAVAGGLKIQELGSVSECLDYETLGYEGQAPGLQRVFAVTADGNRFESTRDITCY